MTKIRKLPDWIIERIDNINLDKSYWMGYNIYTQERTKLLDSISAVKEAIEKGDYRKLE